MNNYFKNLFGHLKTIFIHKYWVFYYCCKLGIPWQGLWHDMSKFSLIELKESIKFYQGGKSSPIPAAKLQQGYSVAWQHHKGRNPHHYEYWTDNYDGKITCIKIPWKYLLEMLADYLAAGKTYNKDKFTYQFEYNWWEGKKEICKINNITKQFITEFFFQLKNAEHNGENFLSKRYLLQLQKRYNLWEEQLNHKALNVQ